MGDWQQFMLTGVGAKGRQRLFSLLIFIYGLIYLSIYGIASPEG